MSPPIRVDEVTLGILKNEKSKQAILERIYLCKHSTFQRDKIINDLNVYYKALRADSELWKEELAERKIWERASNDMLEDL